jgi:MFS family permease
LASVRRLGFGKNGTQVVDDLPPVAETLPAPGTRGVSLRTFDSLTDQSFRWYFVSMLGWFASMNMQQLARGVIVYDMTGSYAALGLISLANAIPGLVLGLPGGLLADRISCKRIVQAGQIGNCVTALSIAILMLTGLITFEYLLIGAVFQGGINAGIMPARQSMIPEIVSKDRLMNAVALSSAGTNIMRLAGPTVGGLLLVVVGPGWVYVTMAMMYLFGALAMMPVRSRPEFIEEKANRPAKTGGFKEGINDLVEGCRYMARDRVIFVVLTTCFMIVLLAQPLQMMLPGFAKDVLNASPGELGLLMSLMGVGALSGSLIVASMRAKRRGLVFISSALIMGITTLAFALSTNLLLSAVIVLAIGVGQSLRMSLSNVLIQTYTEPQYRGRVMSVYMMEFSLVAFGTFIVGIISNAIGVQTALACTGIGLILLSVVCMLFVPKMRNLN